MAEKKIQENPLPEATESMEKTKETLKQPEKPAQQPAATNLPPVIPQTRVNSFPSLTKAAPNDLYRRLLPAALFLLTFVTVMTILLIYMDTVALGAQQFRANMSRDYELRRIAQDEPSLVAYVRQLHLASPPANHQRGPHAPPAADSAPFVPTMELLGDKENGTFVEFLPSGGRDAGSLMLERERGWRGLVVRAAPRDYLTLRSAPPPRHRALHACLSPTTHPREVTYHEHESGAGAGAFSSRVLCLPLYTVLLAAELTRADLLLIGGPSARAALAALPYHKVHLQVIDVRGQAPVNCNKTTQLMLAHKYMVRAQSRDRIVYELRSDVSEETNPVAE